MPDLTDSERLARVDALFDAALDLPIEERSAWLARECGDDGELRAAVEELLRLSDEPSEALDGEGGVGLALLDELAAEVEERRSLPSGERVGPWRLLREIGSGGMGTVYLAERADGEFEQRVALKVLRTSIDSPEAVQRFERERQILAGLEHPDIARLLDGGRTADGRPYLAMEYVDGEPIDRYCDARGLDVAARLALFERVAGAVQFAHQNLVVHRDLKPANIVVTEAGAVKLLDFGIAKPMTERLGTTLTRTWGRVLTPEYASPEQVRGTTVTAASDVYQLGLLLYELLTGRRAQRFEDSSPSAVEREVCERMPERPSTAVRAGGDGEPPSPALARALRGDLDNVVLKALRKEPERRYPSVASLLDDLERYREGRPIRARPDTFGYRARKFVGRHRVGLAATVAGAAIVVVLTAIYLARLRAERDRVRVEAEKSRAALELLLATFDPFDPVLADGQADITARDMLERGVASARRDLADQPEAQARLLDSFGRIYINLGMVEEAEAVLADALAIRRRVLPADHRDLGVTLVHLAMLHEDKGELERADELGSRAVAILRRRDPNGVELGSALKQLASTRANQADFEGARALYDEAVACLEAVGEAGARPLLWARHGLGTLLFDLGDYAAAATTYREVARAARRYPADAATPLAWAVGGEGAAFTVLGRLREGEALLREALALMGERLEGDHPEYVGYERWLATNLVQQGRMQEAETHYRNAIEAIRRLYGPRHLELAKTLHDLAGLLRRDGQLDEARRAIDDCLDILAELLPPGHPHLGRATTAAGWIELEGGAPGVAEERFDRALAILEATFDADHNLVLDARAGRAAAHQALGQSEAACEEWRELESLLATAQVASETRDHVVDAVARCPASG